MSTYMIMCHYGSTSACVSVNRNSSIDSLHSFVFTCWPEIPSSLYMGYSFTDVTSFCEIKTAEDFTNMLNVADTLNIRLISITVYNSKASTLCIESCGIMSALNRSLSCDSNTSSNRSIDVIKDNIRFSMLSRWANCIVGSKQVFEGGAVEFHEALIKHSLFGEYEYVFKRNNDFRVKAVCKYSHEGNDPNFPIVGSGCRWLIMASGGGHYSTFFIRKYIPEHTCGSSAITRKNPRFSSQIIAQIVLEKMHINESYSGTELKKDLEKEYGFDISYNKAWYAIKKANAIRFGEYNLSYEQLRLYCVSANESNPGSHISFESDREGRFLRVFVAFHACIEGFNYCRPMLFCDSTFLKGRYRGQMLAATAKDGNQQLFQVAYAIVNSETIENWEWFFRHMNVILKPDRVVTFISDRNEGLKQGVSAIFPWSPHGYCTEHLKNNLRVALSNRPPAFKEAIKKLFNKVIFASSIEYCHEKLEKMKRLGGDRVVAFLNGIELVHYSDAYFQGERYGEVTSNAAKSLNNKFRNERGLPLTGLIDAVRVKIMSDMTAKRDVAASWMFDICPHIDKELLKRLSVGRLWEAIKCSEHMYEVRAKRAVSINLAARTCTCMKWQMHRLPCAHALCAILKSGLPLVSFIDQFYLTSTFRQTYALPVLPVPTIYLQSTESEASSPVKPPICKIQAGRPKKSRIPSIGEPPKRQMTCSRCGRRGHNRKGCRDSIDS